MTKNTYKCYKLYFRISNDTLLSYWKIKLMSLSVFITLLQLFPLFHISLAPVLFYLSGYEGVWCLYMRIKMFMFDSQVRIWLDQGDRYKRKSWQKLIIFLVAYGKKKRDQWTENEIRTLKQGKKRLWTQTHFSVSSFDSPQNRNHKKPNHSVVTHWDLAIER